MSGKNGAEKVSEIDGHVSKQYEIIRRLGKGAYGIVWKAIEKKSKETVAVKKIFDAFRNQTDAQRTFREIMFLMSFANHENIIRLLGLHKANNDRDIYLVFEFMETDLHNVIKRGNILKDIHKVFIMYQLFKAIKYIHSGNVIHRDLKPSNVLLNAQCHCKIADFGLARSVTQIGEGDGETGTDPILTDYVATRWYRAPEILIASKRYTKGIDMWSLGCILGEMLLGKPLFPGSSTINQVERIMATLPPPTKDDLVSVSAGYGSNLLEKMPAGPRRSLKDLLPEVSSTALALIGSLIVFNPSRRLTAVEALEHPYVADFHRRGNEPERGSSVIPLLRDDVQLSVEEYRNKLYAMMDERHRKHKNTPKSRVRRFSEHIRKETIAQIANGGNPVVGQGDAIVNKNLRSSCGDLRKDKSRDDLYELFRVGDRTMLANRKTGPSHGDLTGRMVRAKMPDPAADVVQDERKNSRHNGRSAAMHYAYNLSNGNLGNLSGAVKSCLYLSQQQQQQQQQQHLSKSQRSIQSDQVTAYGPAARSSQLVPPARLKLRKGVSRQRAPPQKLVATTATGSPFHDSRALPAFRKWSTEQDRLKNAQSRFVTRIPRNVTKMLTKVGGGGAQDAYGQQTKTSSSDHCENVRNRLTHSMRSVHDPRDENRQYGQAQNSNNPSRRFFGEKNVLIDRLTRSSEERSSKMERIAENNRFRSANITRTDVPRIQSKHSIIGAAADRKYSAANPKTLNSYSQCHGVITASAYKDLRNETMKW